MREEYGLANARDTSEHHHQAVDTDSETACGRKPVLQCDQVVLVQRVGFEVALRLGSNLFVEALALVDRVVQLAESVSELDSDREELETLDEPGIGDVDATAGGLSSGGCVSEKSASTQ